MTGCIELTTAEVQRARGGPLEEAHLVNARVTNDKESWRLPG